MSVEVPEPVKSLIQDMLGDHTEDNAKHLVAKGILTSFAKAVQLGYVKHLVQVDAGLFFLLQHTVNLKETETFATGFLVSYTFHEKNMFPRTYNLCLRLVLNVFNPSVVIQRYGEIFINPRYDHKQCANLLCILGRMFKKNVALPVWRFLMFNLLHCLGRFVNTVDTHYSKVLCMFICNIVQSCDQLGLSPTESKWVYTFLFHCLHRARDVLPLNDKSTSYYILASISFFSKSYPLLVTLEQETILIDVLVRRLEHPKTVYLIAVNLMSHTSPFEVLKHVLFTHGDDMNVCRRLTDVIMAYPRLQEEGFLKVVDDFVVARHLSYDEMLDFFGFMFLRGSSDKVSPGKTSTANEPTIDVHPNKRQRV
jgi:hypothetical protein